MNATIAAVMVGLAALLAAIGLLSGEDEKSKPRAAEGPSIAQVARKVERVRELRFERLPRVRRVSGEEARAEGLRELDRQVPVAERRAEERLLKLLGLLPPDETLRELMGDALRDEVAGYYSPDNGTLAIVGNSGMGGLLGQVTLAHELTHALEDQHFGLDVEGSTGFRRDRAVADATLREGTATVAMLDYVIREQAGTADVPASLREEALGELAEVAIPASSGLPRYVRESFVFPYVAGAQLVNGIEGEGGWDAVNRAFGRDAPVSSEQVMHPEKYERRERPLRVRVPPLGDAIPRGTRMLEQGDFGEFDTEQLLREANGEARARRAAAGWGGGAFALIELPGGTCEEPCRDRYVLVLRWEWDSEREAREFEPAIRRTARALGSAATAREGETTALALAPRGAAALAKRAVAD